jgi:hypothetical protein
MLPAGSTIWNRPEPSPHEHELTLSIESSGEVRASSAAGSEARGAVDLDTLHRQMIELFDSLVRERRLKLRREFELFGALLLRSLMPSDVELLLERELLGAREAGTRLRLQLLFREPASISGASRGEYAYRPADAVAGKVFLGTAVDLVLSRYLPLQTDRGSLAPERPPLRMLVAASKPAELGPVVTSEPIEAIRRLADGRAVEVHELAEATLDKLMEALRSHRPHIVHLMGHGRYLPELRRGEIALLEADGSALWLDDERFAELFAQAQATPRLVFLHLCEGGASDYKADFAGLAPQLVRRDVQAVVAMQYPITNRTAVAFSTGFYEQLAAGAPVDHAVQAGDDGREGGYRPAARLRCAGALHAQPQRSARRGGGRREPHPGRGREMSDFGLRLDVSRGGTVRGTKLGEEGDLSDAKLQYDDLRKRTLEVFKDLLNSRRVQSDQELEVLGEHLFAMLFVDEVQQAFWEMFEKRSPEKRLVVRLSFAQDAYELAALPWEYLFAPHTGTRPGFFLAAKVNLVLSRYLPVDQATAHPLEPGPLRVLLLVSEPSDSEMKHVELEKLETTIRECANVELHISADATRTGFTGPIDQCRPHILHVIGQGRARSPVGAEIALVGSDGTQDWVPESIFAEAFGATDGIRGSWCCSYGVERRRRRSRAQLRAPRPGAVRAQIPAVVAMRHPWPTTASRFSKWFYNYLADGQTIRQRRCTGALDAVAPASRSRGRSARRSCSCMRSAA